jgi:hypothetical protein
MSADRRQGRFDGNWQPPSARQKHQTSPSAGPRRNRNKKQKKEAEAEAGMSRESALWTALTQTLTLTCLK